jgi:hypothetical protein
MDADFHFMNVPSMLRAEQTHECDFRVGPKAVILDYGGAQKPAVFKLKVLGLCSLEKSRIALTPSENQYNSMETFNKIVIL